MGEWCPAASWRPCGNVRSDATQGGEMSPDEVPCGNVRGGQGLEDLTAGGCEGKKVIRERKGTLIMVPGGSMPGGSVLSVGRGCCRVKPCGSAGSI